MRQHCIAIALLVVLPAGPAGAGDETAADILRVALPVAAYSVTFARDDGDGRQEFHRVLASTTVVTAALKLAVDKRRPDGAGSDAFPSGHAATAVAGAGFLARRYGWRYGVPALAVAAWVAANRVATDQHDVADVAGGAAVALLANAALASRHASGMLAVLPWSRNGAVGVQLTAAW